MFGASNESRGQGNDSSNKIAWDSRVHTVGLLSSGHNTYFDKKPELGRKRLESSHPLESDAKGHNWFSSFRKCSAENRNLISIVSADS